MDEQKIKKLVDSAVTIAGEDYWVVLGKLNRSYLIHQETLNVHHRDGTYISIVQPPFGHDIKDISAVIMALKNDDVMSEYIPTLKK